MCKSDLHQFLTELPKCEHHLHLEGCLSPRLFFQLAAKNNIELPDPKTDPAYASIEALETRYRHFNCLDDFLQCYYRALDVLVTREDFAVLAWDYFTTADADGVRHAEVFFDPQSHTSRGIPFAIVVSGFRDACARAEKELGITSRLIMCFLRHLPVESAAGTMQSAVDGGYFDGDDDESRTITALGLDSSEVGFPPELFRDMYAEAKRRGIHRTAHGGEEGDPSYISGVLDALYGERVDHGVRLVEDPELMRRVVAEGILLTVCPLSNVCLQVVKDVSELPIRTFLEAGVKFSINSDDPAYFGGYVLNNYCAVQEAFGFGHDDWKVIAENSVNGSWIGDSRKAELVAMILECVAKFQSRSN